jgi:hypothetical protein
VRVYFSQRTIDIEELTFKKNEYAPIPKIESRPFNLEVEELLKKYVGSGSLANTPLSKADILANKNSMRIKMHKKENEMIRVGFNFSIKIKN